MATTGVQIDGLDELREALRLMPSELRADAETIVLEGANETAAEIRPKYEAVRSVKPKGIKNPIHLADAVVVRNGSDGSAARASVVVKAPHAHLFEFGARHMSGRPTLVPAAQRARRKVVGKLAYMVRRAGFEVSTDGQ